MDDSYGEKLKVNMEKNKRKWGYGQGGHELFLASDKRLEKLRITGLGVQQTHNLTYPNTFKVIWDLSGILIYFPTIYMCILR